MKKFASEVKLSREMTLINATLISVGAEDDDNTLEGNLGHTAQPVTAVPDNYKPIEKLMMTYDGSWPSARANQSFIQFGL